MHNVGRLILAGLVYMGMVLFGLATLMVITALARGGLFVALATVLVPLLAGAVTLVVWLVRNWDQRMWDA